MQWCFIPMGTGHLYLLVSWRRICARSTRTFKRNANFCVKGNIGKTFDEDPRTGAPTEFNIDNVCDAMNEQAKCQGMFV